MKKLALVALVMMLSVALAVPAFALGDNENSQQQGQNFEPKNKNISSNENENEARAESRSSSESDSRSSSDQLQGQLQGQAQGQGQGQIAAQGQGQLGIVSPSQDVNVGGDTQKTTTYVMTSPDTVAGQGQQAASIYSVFGGINTAESAEYNVCIEKIRVLSQMKEAKLITEELAQAEAMDALAQLKDASQPKRVLGFLWKTRGVHVLNGVGLLATDGCNEVNIDNWFGLKNLGKKK